MRINVAQQLKSSVGTMRRYVVNHTTDEGVCLQGEAKLVLTNRSILITGRFRTAIECICSRCLEEFEHHMEFDLEEEFFPTGAIMNAPLPPIDEEKNEERFIIGEDHILDISEALRQNLFLNSPTKPVCQQECAGLCQKCGQNLNEGPCNCSTEQIDPRWTRLRELLSD